MDHNRSTLLDAIDLMEPETFEEWVLSEVARVSYRVSRTPRTGDGGADGIARSRARPSDHILFHSDTRSPTP